MKAFTIIEILIVMAIIGVLIGFGFANLNFGSRNDLNLSVNEIVAALRNAQSNSMTQEKGSEWSVHFENPPSNKGFYEIYKESIYSSANVVSHINLRETVKFDDPSSGSSKNISFSVLSGFPSGSGSDVIIISLKNNPSETKTINIKANGQIEY